MCTVTIIPINETDFVLTSNRDEAPNRISLKPEIYTIEDTKMLFPKDKLAGGSWIGVSDKNRVLCVLNGAFIRHERQTNYRLSRGVVVRDLLACKTIAPAIEDYNLNGVEPFTLVIADWNKTLQFFELIWDGSEKHFKELPLEPKIWSSSTLYSQEMRQDRQDWFKAFKSENKLDAESLMQFHKTTHIENTDYGVIMDRGFVKTTSVSQIKKVDDTIKMHFNNMQDDSISETEFKLSQVMNG